eukprot:15108250-Ditylum_brightwellii.AAC.1
MQGCKNVISGLKIVKAQTLLLNNDGNLKQKEDRVLNKVSVLTSRDYHVPGDIAAILQSTRMEHQHTLGRMAVSWDFLFMGG